MHLSDYANEVGGWNAKAGHLRDNQAFDADRDYRELALALIEEEVAELRGATQGGEEPDFIEILDAVGDILFTLFGFTTKAGINHYIEPVLEEIIYSNNTKLLGEKKVLPNGKIGKGDQYVAPDISAVVNEVNASLA